jgi:hypothetical protein
LEEQDDEVKGLKASKSILEKHEITSNTVLLEGQKTNLTLVVNLIAKARGMDCQLSRRPVFGAHDWIIFVQFEDKLEWVARIPLRSHDNRRQLPFDSELFKERYECMIATIDYVANHTHIPVPRIHHYDLSCNNVLLRPYILMDCLPGKPMSSILENLDDEQIQHVVKQWAQYTMDLASLQFPQIGSLGKNDDETVVKQLLPVMHGAPPMIELKDGHGPFSSVADYIFAMSNLKKRVVTSGKVSDPHAYGNFLRSSLVESLIPFFVLPEYLNGPFVLSHRTLDMQSILVDSSGRLSGILSWQNAAVLPLQSHIRLPETLNMEFMPPSEKLRAPAVLKFSTLYRPHFEKAMIEKGTGTPWNVEDLLDRSLMFGLFERAILSAEDERFLPALWEHVFGNALGAEDFRGAMKQGDWGVAMADRWGIKVENK